MKHANLRLGMALGLILSGGALSGCELGFDRDAFLKLSQGGAIGEAPRAEEKKTIAPPQSVDARDPFGDLAARYPETRYPEKDSKGKGKRKDRDYGDIPYHPGKKDYPQQRKKPIDHRPWPGDDWPEDHHPGRPDRPEYPDPDYPGHHPGGRDRDPEWDRERDEDALPAREGIVSEPCSSDEPDGICLAVKYVSYVDARGAEVESEIDAIRDIQQANEIWSECGIQFQIDEYRTVRPSRYSLNYRLSSYRELNDVRETFSTPDQFLVVATGNWDRSGAFGSDWANAWTNLPGENVYGVVMENTVSRHPQILAHELGHYLNLPHQDDPSALMNPVVHRSSERLSERECRAARWAARTYWREMFR